MACTVGQIIPQLNVEEAAEDGSPSGNISTRRSKTSFSPFSSRKHHSHFNLCCFIKSAWYPNILCLQKSKLEVDCEQLQQVLQRTATTSLADYFIKCYSLLLVDL
ncbi:hypothetical protein PO909_022850 [Leuciscus waleckii]